MHVVAGTIVSLAFIGLTAYLTSRGNNEGAIFSGLGALIVIGFALRNGG